MKICLYHIYLNEEEFSKSHFVTDEGYLSLWHILEFNLSGRRLSHLDASRPNLQVDSIPGMSLRSFSADFE